MNSTQKSAQVLSEVFKAAVIGDTKWIRTLVEKNPSLLIGQFSSIGDIRSLPLLFHITRLASLEIVRYLIEELHFDPNILSLTNKLTLLYYFIERGNLNSETLLYLLAACDNINNVVSNGDTALSFIVKNSEKIPNAEQFVLIMLANGCLPSVNIADRGGHIPVVWSRFSEETNLKMITRENANYLNFEGKPYLAIFLSRFRHNTNVKQTVIRCLECGADPNFTLPGHNNGLYLSLAYSADDPNKGELFRLFLKYGAKLDAANRAFFNMSDAGMKFVKMADDAARAVALMSYRIHRLGPNSELSKIDPSIIKELVLTFL
jgi:hypothetical protein